MIINRQESILNDNEQSYIINRVNNNNNGNNSIYRDKTIIKEHINNSESMREVLTNR